MTNDNMINALKGKYSKASVSYTNTGHPDAHCSICQHYVNKDTCKIVAGPIVPGGWCKEFKASKG